MGFPACEFWPLLTRPLPAWPCLTEHGTGSEGQSIEVTFTAPINKFTTTGERNLDMLMPVTADTDVDAWFSQVVTPDNVATVMD